MYISRSFWFDHLFFENQAKKYKKNSLINDMARWWPGLLKNNVITGLLKSKKTAQQPNMKA
jgi:hypothetical protein